MTRPALIAALRAMLARGCGIPAARDHARLLLSILTRYER